MNMNMNIKIKYEFKTARMTIMAQFKLPALPPPNVKVFWQRHWHEYAQKAGSGQTMNRLRILDSDKAIDLQGRHDWQ